MDPPSPPANLMSTQDLRYIFSRWEKKKSHSPYGQVLPLLPKAGLFFSAESGSKLFSQPLQRATTGPWPLGTTEGVEHGGRGVYVTQHAREASRWEKKLQCTGRGEKKKRGRRGVWNWKVLSASRQEPQLCENDLERKSTTQTCHVLKIFRSISKRSFYFTKIASKKKTKTMQPTVNQGRREKERRCYPLLNCILLSNAPFALCLTNFCWRGKSKLLELREQQAGKPQCGGFFYTTHRLELHREEEPSVSLQTPPCTAHFKCSRMSSTATNTGHMRNATNRWRIGRQRGEEGRTRGR